MERVVEPWDPDLHGREGREQLRGARIGEIRGDVPPCAGNSEVRTAMLGSRKTGNELHFQERGRRAITHWGVSVSAPTVHQAGRGIIARTLPPSPTTSSLPLPYFRPHCASSGSCNSLHSALFSPMMRFAVTLILV